MSIMQSWEEFRPTKGQALWFGIGCVAATLIVGFGFAGWVTGGKAQQMVSEASTNARQELATAVCVEEFMAASDARARLAKLSDASWYERSELVSEGGWATMPDREQANSAVASLCAGKLAELEVKQALKPASVSN